MVVVAAAMAAAEAMAAVVAAAAVVMAVAAAATAVVDINSTPLSRIEAFFVNQLISHVQIQMYLLLSYKRKQFIMLFI
jgi:hypothetical protein